MFWGYLGHVIVEGPRKQISAQANLACQSFPTQMRRSAPKQVCKHVRSNFIFHQRGRVHIVGASSVSSVKKNQGQRWLLTIPMGSFFCLHLFFGRKKTYRKLSMFCIKFGVCVSFHVCSSS